MANWGGFLHPLGVHHIDESPYAVYDLKIDGFMPSDNRILAAGLLGLTTPGLSELCHRVIGLTPPGSRIYATWLSHLKPAQREPAPFHGRMLDYGSSGGAP